MKKYIAVAIVWFFILCVKVSSTTEAISYQLYMDTNRQDLYEVKESILQTYEELMKGVNNESDAMMVVNHLDHFVLDDTMQVSWKANQLVLVVGDGKGAFIEGELQRNMLCMPQVKPKSIFQEIFGS